MREQGRTIRNRTNWVSGWLLAIGVPAFVIGVADPLSTHRVAASDPGWNATMVLATVMAAVVSLGGYLLFARPMVVLGPTHLRIRNPLSDHVVARDDITQARSGLWYPRVVVGGRSIRMLGLEQSLWQTLQGAPKQRGITAALDPEESREATYPARHATTVESHEPGRTSVIELADPARDLSRRGLGRLGTSLLGLWLGYLLVGWLAYRGVL